MNDEKIQNQRPGERQTVNHLQPEQVIRLLAALQSN